MTSAFGSAFGGSTFSGFGHVENLFGAPSSDTKSGVPGFATLGDALNSDSEVLVSKCPSPSSAKSDHSPAPPISDCASTTLRRPSLVFHFSTPTVQPASQPTFSASSPFGVRLHNPHSSSFEVASYTKSREFWFEDGSVVIKVENTIYKVYKGLLTRQSEIFKTKINSRLESPPFRVQAAAGKKKGPVYTTVQPDPPRLVGMGSENSPLVLSVAKADFELVLSYLFPADYQSQYDFTLDEWSAISRVSKELELHSIRAVAISHILKNNSSALDLIDIGKKQGIKECCLEGVRLLCTREESLTLEEGERLGMKCVIAIAQARDFFARGSSWSEHDTSVEFEAMK